MDNSFGLRPYGCFRCRNRVALHDDIIRKDFVSGRRKAFLFTRAMNVTAGPEKETTLITGLHSITDVHCSDCGEYLGWRYEKADPLTEKYKEGKFVLIMYKIIKENW